MEKKEEAGLLFFWDARKENLEIAAGLLIIFFLGKKKQQQL